jgi:heme-degrading monooxygenase HmoA
LKILAAASASSGALAAAGHPIQLHVDLEVDPAKEKDLAATYEKTFHPAIRKQPGFVDVKLMKLRSTLGGTAPAHSNYRLLISFQTEEQRKAWVATELHQKVWPQMESNLKSKNYNVLLYDPI